MEPQRLSFFNPRRWTFESASVWILVASVVVSTVLFIPLASVPFLYTKISLLALGGAIAFACYALARMTLGNIITPPLPLLGALWLVPIAYGLSAVFSGAPSSLTVFGHAFESDTFSFMLLAGFLGTLAALTIRRAEHVRSFFRIGTWLVAFVLAVQALILIVGWFSPATINPAASIIGSYSDLGVFAGLAVVAMLVALRFMPLARRTRIVFGVMIAVSFLYMALATATTAWVLVALTALGLFVEGVMRRSSAVASATTLEIDDMGDVSSVDMTSEELYLDEENGQSRLVTTPLVVLAVAVFFLIGGSTTASLLGSALHVNVSNVRPSWQATLDIGRHTYQTSPVFGSGPNTFGQQWALYRNTNLNATPFWNTNFTSGIGFIPSSFVTTGIVGIVAWLLFLGLFLFFGIRALVIREMEDPFLRTVATVAFLGTVYVMAQMIFNVPGPVMIILGFVLAGVFASILRYVEPKGQSGIIFAQSPRLGFVSVFVLMLLMLAAIAAAYTVIDRYVAQVNLLQANNAISQGNLQAAEVAVGRSLQLVASDDAYQLQTAIDIARINQLEQNTPSDKATAQKELQAALSQGVAAAHAATQINPDSYQNWFALGSVYQTAVPLGVSGAYDAANKAFDQAAKLYPNNPVIPYTQAQLEIANKSYTKAETLLKQAIQLKQNYTPAILLYSQLEVQLGKAKEALSAAEAAAYFSPNDPSVLFQVGLLREGTGDFAGAATALSQAVSLNPQYANARYFLAVAYAYQGKYAEAVTQLKTIASLSSSNAQAVAADIAALEKHENPFAASKPTSAPTLSGNGNTNASATGTSPAK